MGGARLRLVSCGRLKLGRSKLRAQLAPDALCLTLAGTQPATGQMKTAVVVLRLKKKHVGVPVGVDQKHRKHGSAHALPLELV